MGIDLRKYGAQTFDDLKTLKDLMTNPNPENMLQITFESIENPDYVLELIKDTRDNIVYNN